MTIEQNLEELIPSDTVRKQAEEGWQKIWTIISADQESPASQVRCQYMFYLGYRTALDDQEDSEEEWGEPCTY